MKWPRKVPACGWHRRTEADEDGRRVVFLEVCLWRPRLWPKHRMRTRRQREGAGAPPKPCGRAFRDASGAVRVEVIP